MRILYKKSGDKRCKNINELISEKFPQFLNEDKPELIIVPGGDGAMLHAIQEINYYQVPFFGYGVGNLNFLMNEIPFNKLEPILKKLGDGKLKLHEVTTRKISVNVEGGGGAVTKIGEAANEVVIGSTIMGYHSFVINSGDGSFNDFEIKGSGICISTDLGSTGYNFNLGGSILPLGSDMWSILGIVCNRYLEDILNVNKIEIECCSNHPSSSIFLDGIKNKYKLEKGDKVIIKKGNYVKLVFLDKKEFFEKRINISSRFRKDYANS